MTLTEKINSKSVFFLPLLLLLLLIASSLFFSDSAIAETEYDQIHVRIEKLEKEINKLKLMLAQQRDSEKAKEESVGKIDEKAADSSAGSQPLSQISGLKFQMYGYVKLDASYDDSRTNYGNFILYVHGESDKKNDNEFNITARQTRLGLEIISPHFNDWAPKGKIEIDFYGDSSTTHENKAGVMLRHAFLELKKGNFGLIAGQTSDIFSPLNPYTLNYTVGWSAGNIGYRRPRLGITNNLSLGNGMRLITGLGISRTAGLTNEDLDLGGQNDGEDAGFPTIQARFALAGKFFVEKEITLGISGHYGEEEIDLGEGEQRLNSWSINLDFDIPLSNKFSLKGEAFTGSNLDDYFGGILQGNSSSRNVVRTTGGWSQVNYKLDNRWQYNAGAGFDNPDDEDLDTGMRSKNSFIYFNALYSPLTPLTIGLEYSHWETEYKNTSDGTDNRFQTSFIYSW